MINMVSETKDLTSELALPFIKLKDLSERDLKRRREHIKSRLLDEERIRKEKELKRQKKFKEKQENCKLLSEKNYIWDKEFINERAFIKLTPLICNGVNSKEEEENTTSYQPSFLFPITKPYLTLFDTSSYQFPLGRQQTLRQRDLLLRFNTEASIVEVQSDFHPKHDCGVYRNQLKDQIRIKRDILEGCRKSELKLDELHLQNYPFGLDGRLKYQERFPKTNLLTQELGKLDEKFFPWCTSFGKPPLQSKQQQQRKTAIHQNFEPIICKTKTNYVKM